MKLKDSELKSILAEVETEIASLLKSEGDALKKAKDDGDDAESAPADSSAPAEGSAPAEASAPDASASPEASAPAPEAPAPDMSAAPAPEASAPAADPAAEASAPADPEALKAEYSKLDPESLKAHYMAAKAALFEMMGAAGAGGPPGAEASAPAPMAAPPAGPEASASAPPPALKAELKDVPATAKLDNAGGSGGKAAVPDDVKALGKSEKDIEVEDLKAQVELLAKAVDLALGTPVRKAVTSVAHLPKTEETAPTKELSKSEVQEKIKKAMAGGKLTKNQKDSLFSYTLGNTEFDQIKDLLEVK